MYIIITKDGKPVDAFYKPNRKGYIELDYQSPIAKAYLYSLGVKA